MPPFKDRVADITLGVIIFIGVALLFIVAVNSAIKVKDAPPPNIQPEKIEVEWVETTPILCATAEEAAKVDLSTCSVIASFASGAVPECSLKCTKNK